MGYRLTKIYTRTGDDGSTSVEPKKRVKKNSALIESLGTLDELNSAIGLTLSGPTLNSEMKKILTQIQHDLFDCGGELCPPHRNVITAEKVTHLEKIIDQWNGELPPLKEFILPGGSFTSASCHLARAICRRAERCLVTLNEQEPFNPEILRYINRLSDVLFVAARIIAKDNHKEEKLWEHTRG